MCMHLYLKLIFNPVSRTDISKMRLCLQNMTPINLRGGAFNVRIYIGEVKDTYYIDLVKFSNKN